MVLTSSIIASFLIALARGGRLRALKTLRFDGLHFLAGAIVLRILLILPPLQSFLVQGAVGDLRYGGLLYSGSLLLTLLSLLANVRLPGFRLVATGMAFNFLVIAANLGQMPGALDKITAAGFPGSNPERWSNFAVMNEDTRFWFLGDNFLIGYPWPLPSVISFGDIVIILGVFWFFQKALAPARA
ncbi:MAG: DUF5317 family protein [Dehalococcoidia bacterium]|nr:DUF5317 family protein [Dehalococcoidia bacterium]